MLALGQQLCKFCALPAHQHMIPGTKDKAALPRARTEQSFKGRRSASYEQI